MINQVTPWKQTHSLSHFPEYILLFLDDNGDEECDGFQIEQVKVSLVLLIKVLLIKKACIWRTSRKRWLFRYIIET